MAGLETLGFAVNHDIRSKKYIILLLKWIIKTEIIFVLNLVAMEIMEN